MGDEVATNEVPIRFSIFTRQWDPSANMFVPSALKAVRGADGRLRLDGIASSTVKDLHGDTMLLTALEDMELAANQNLTIFGNHEYRVPEDVYGSVETAKIRPSGTVDAAGDPIYDLSFGIVVNENNPRAVETWKAIDNKTKLGLSIGAMIPEGGALRDKKSGAYTIKHVELLETSIVGIPANPRSWVENAVKSLRDSRTAKAASTMSLGQPELSLDTDSGIYQIRGQLADITGLSIKAGEVIAGIGEIDVPDDAVLVATHEKCGTKILNAFPEGLCSKCGEPGPFLNEWMTPEAAKAATTDTTISPEVADAATCPDCGRGKGSAGDCGNQFHKDVEPDVTDAKVTIIEVDTGTPAAAGDSEPADDDPPDDEFADASAVVDAVKGITGSLDESIAGTIQTLLDLSNGLLKALTESKKAEREALTAKAAAEQERDRVVAVTGDLIGKTNALVQRLGDLRVGPKAIIRDVGDQMDDLRGIYSATFIDMLKEGQKK